MYIWVKNDKMSFQSIPIRLTFPKILTLEYPTNTFDVDIYDIGQYLNKNVSN